MVNGNETPAQDAALETRSKALFDASVAELDGGTRSRLCQARHAALAEARQRPRAVWWMPAAATAAVAVMVALILPGLQTPNTLSEDNLAAADDLTLLMNDESLDLLEEMEFYAWLAETDAIDSPAEPGSSET